MNFDIDAVGELDGVVSDACHLAFERRDLAEQTGDVIESDSSLRTIDREQHDDSVFAGTQLAAPIEIQRQDSGDDRSDAILTGATTGDGAELRRLAGGRIPFGDFAEELELGGVERLAEHGFDDSPPPGPAFPGEERPK